jgi:hypothetical protein
MMVRIFEHNLFRLICGIAWGGGVFGLGFILDADGQILSSEKEKKGI